MKRRDLIKSLGVTAGTIALSSVAEASVAAPVRKKKALKIAHITDVHIRPEHNAVARFKKCLEMIKKDKVELILNGVILFMLRITTTLPKIG